MTAVEFLESEIPKLVYIAKSNKVKFDELINQAKVMEKEQIAKAIDDDFMDHIRRTTTMHELNKSE